MVIFKCKDSSIRERAEEELPSFLSMMHTAMNLKIRCLAYGSPWPKRLPAGVASACLFPRRLQPCRGGGWVPPTAAGVAGEEGVA